VNTPLSPAAQAVLDAVASQMEGGWISPDFIPYEAKKIAAALRAATSHGEYMFDPLDGKIAVVRVSDLQSWATELEGADG